MWNKHAIWCQCASVASAVLTLAALVSVRTFSASIDLYWTTILGAQCVAQFFAAEHTHLGYTPEQWHIFEQKRSLACHWLVAAWSVFHWTNSRALFVSTLACMVAVLPLRWTRKHQRYILPATTLLVCVRAPLHLRTWTRTLPWLISQHYCRRVRLHNTSMAGTAIKQQYAWRAAAILAESCLYWSFRCTQRFPHTFRWGPLWTALCAVLLAAAICQRWVAPTRVSHNAIIQSGAAGHWMAASIASAQRCSACAKRLTALDVESSFHE